MRVPSREQVIVVWAVNVVVVAMLEARGGNFPEGVLDCCATSG